MLSTYLTYVNSACEEEYNLLSELNRSLVLNRNEWENQLTKASAELQLAEAQYRYVRQLLIC